MDEGSKASQVFALEVEVKQLKDLLKASQRDHEQDLESLKTAAKLEFEQELAVKQQQFEQILEEKEKTVTSLKSQSQNVSYLMSLYATHILYSKELRNLFLSIIVSCTH
jgi:hypothetical protein